MSSPEQKLSPDLPEITAEAWNRVLSGSADASLASTLAGTLTARRWYRDKTKTIRGAHIDEVVPVTGTDAYLVTLQLEYTQGESQIYLLGLAVAKETVALRVTAEHPETVLVKMLNPDGRQDDLLYDAFSNQTFATALLTAIAQGTCINGRHGEFAASHTRAFDRIRGSAKLDLKAKLSAVEQSNTSIIYGDCFILKIFRKLEQGINPDIEIGVFLTEREFRNSPAVAGLIEYRSAAGQSSYVGILQQFVANQGDAWKFTLDSLGAYFRSALASQEKPPALDSHHPLTLLSGGTLASELIGPYLQSAELLGKRTAQMHAALTDSHAGPDFLPEPFGLEDTQQLYADLMSQADATFELLRQQKTKLTGEALQDADKVLEAEPQIRKRFEAALQHKFSAMRIRHHGDYHLGQVLYTGDDFQIIDYEGEPARSLAERRRKSLAMRDVAGMIRSFQYAAYSALFKVMDADASPEQLSKLEPYAAFWTSVVSAAFLKSYFSAAGQSAFLPDSAQERRILFDVFLLQKALYEVAYELNNRPSWISIPLRGILTLVD